MSEGEEYSATKDESTSFQTSGEVPKVEEADLLRGLDVWTARDRNRGRRRPWLRLSSRRQRLPIRRPRPGFIFVRTILVQSGKCSPFLELTPTLRQMPRDVTNISED